MELCQLALTTQRTLLSCCTTHPALLTDRVQRPKLVVDVERQACRRVDKRFVMKHRVAIQSNDSPAQAGAGGLAQGEDGLPTSEEQRLNALRCHLHDAAFSFLRSGA